MKTTPTSRHRAHRPDTTPGNPPVVRVSAPKNGGNFPSGGFCVTKRRRWIFSPLLEKWAGQEVGGNFTFPKFREKSENVKKAVTSSRWPFSRMDRKIHVCQNSRIFPERENFGYFFQPAGFQQVAINFTFGEFSEKTPNVNFFITSWSSRFSGSNETFHVSRIFRKFVKREIFDHFLLDPNFKKRRKKSRFLNFGKIPRTCFFPSLLARGRSQEVAGNFKKPGFLENSGNVKSLPTSDRARFPTSTATFHVRAAAPKNGALKAACGAGFGRAK